MPQEQLPELPKEVQDKIEKESVLYSDNKPIYGVNTTEDTRIGLREGWQEGFKDGGAFGYSLAMQEREWIRISKQLPEIIKNETWSGGLFLSDGERTFTGRMHKSGDFVCDGKWHYATTIKFWMNYHLPSPPKE